MFPLKDLNRSSIVPHVNRLLLIVNVAVFVVFWLSSEGILFDAKIANSIEQNFVMTPEEILHGERLFTLFTSMFMHAGWIHLIGNMIFLFVFGDNVEDVFGHLGYLLFYLLCGLVADFAHVMSVLGTVDVVQGVVGASGAISGALGAYAVLFPKAKVLTLVTFVVLPVPAIVYLGFWFGLQWLSVYYGTAGGVAVWAHIGGFIAGVLLALVFGLRRKKRRESRLRL